MILSFGGLLKLYAVAISVISCFNSHVTEGYKLLERKYDNNSIDVYVGQYPPGVECISMLFNTVDELSMPGNYRHINWKFNSVKTINSENNDLNEIYFMYIPDHKGQTTFKVLNGIILEFEMLINPYGLTRTTMYNVVLHEMAHVFLLDHGEYRDSLSGYLLRVMPTGGIVQATERIKMTEDDCYGIYIKMINDIIMSDYTYAIYLNNLMQSQCKKYETNTMFAIHAHTSMLRPSVSYRSGVNYYNLIEYQPFDNDLRIIDL